MSFPSYKAHRMALISVSLAHQPDTSLHCQTTDTELVYVQAFAGTHCAYPQRDGQAELTWVAGYIARWFTRLQTVTYPSTNWARH